MSFLTTPSQSARSFGRKARSAFTLLEILIALAIMGLLVGLAVTKLGGIFDGAKTDTAHLFVKESLNTALSAYKIHMGDYPSTDEGIQALIAAPAKNADRWHGPYIEGAKKPIDPWGEEYLYKYPGTHNKTSYDLWSKGPDKTDGTDDDIGNW